MSNSYYNQGDSKAVCTFYSKIGACRHGERCSREHVRPSYSRVVMLSNLYRNPVYECQKFKEEEEKKKAGGGEEEEDVTPRPDENDPLGVKKVPGEPDEHEKKFLEQYQLPPQYIYTEEMSKEEVQRKFDEFFKDIFIEVSLKYGFIDDMVVTENFNHLNGNVFIKFQNEQDADKLVGGLTSRWFDSRPVFVELSPVYKFDEAICGSYEESGKCSRENSCNFWHLKHPSSGLRRQLFGAQKKHYQEWSMSYDRGYDRGRYRR